MNNQTSSLEFSHFPVMLNEVIKILTPLSDKKFIDCTFGGGGYSKELLNFSNNEVHAIDRDKKALLVANELKKKFPKIIKDVRGRGFLIGLQLYGDQTNFIEDLMKNKLLTIRAAENVVRILPPLNVKKNEIDQALKIINKVCLRYI